MNLFKLKFNKQMIEIDETTNFLEFLIDEDEKFNQPVNIVSYYLDDNTNFWIENPLFTIVSWEDNYHIVHHYSDIEVFNDIYNVLTKNNLIEGAE